MDDTKHCRLGKPLETKAEFTLLYDIIKTHNEYQNDSKYSDELEKKRNEIAKTLTEGKISESQYTILNDRISDYEEEIKNNVKTDIGIGQNNNSTNQREFKRSPI